MKRLATFILALLLAPAAYAGWTGEQTFEGDVEFRNPVTMTDALTIEDAVTINEANADVDFIVEGDTVEDLFILDASADAVGIGGDATPDATLEVAASLPATTNVLLISSQNASTAILTIENTGSVEEMDLRAGFEFGLGDASPDAILEVVPEAGDTYSLLISSQNGSTNVIAVDHVAYEIEVVAGMALGLGDASPEAILEVVPEASDLYSVRVSSQDGSTNIFAVDGRTQEVEFTNGFILPWSRTAAQIDTLAASAVGQIIYCSDCTVKNTCISTGTAAAQWMRQDLATAGCGSGN